jgi:hypothetical protein
MSSDWRNGNAAEDGRETRGWFLGHFIEPSGDIRSSSDIEVKWGIHPPGDKRTEGTADERRTTLALLVRGNFRINLAGESIALGKQGDYAMWKPGVNHSWEALTESIVLTLRWPSSPA